jgi:hypothetical protein
MAKVEVAFGAVVGHIDLAVLIWRHRPGIDVQIGVELANPDLEPARLEERPSEAESRPFPREDTTPPVTKMNRAMGLTA